MRFFKKLWHNQPNKVLDVCAVIVIIVLLIIYVRLLNINNSLLTIEGNL